MRNAILICLTLVSLTATTSCIRSTGRQYQEVDDVYVTESDRASERADELAKAEGVQKTEEGNDNSDMSPAPEETQEKQERKTRRANSGGARVALYVLGGLLEIAFNLLIIWLFW